MPPRDNDHRDPPRERRGSFRDRDPQTDEWEVTAHGQHRVSRDGGRQKRDEGGIWVMDDPVELDPHPSNPRQAGQSVGEFIGGLVDGARKNVPPSTFLVVVAALLGLGGGLGGHEVASSLSPTPTEEQVDVLLRAIQKQNLELADLNRRLSMLEIKRELGKTLPDAIGRSLPVDAVPSTPATEAVDAEAKEKAAAENAELEAQIEGAGK
jgi:hypothetical protein